MKSLILSMFSAIFTLLLKSQARAIGKGCRANGLVRGRNLFIGDDCHFNGMTVYGRGRVTIGSRFHSGKRLTILTEFHNYEGRSLPYDETTVIKDVEIGRNVWVGLDVCIMGGITIGEGAIVQARSVVVNDVPPLAIVGGHPAAVFKFRDRAHYDSLKDAE